MKTSAPHNSTPRFPSKEKPWLKYYEPGVEKTQIPSLSIYQIIKDRNRFRLAKTAIDYRSSQDGYKTGYELTYGEFFNRIDDVAKAYSVIGAKPNEIIVTILPNVPESRILIYGLNALGVTVYPVSPMLSPLQLKKILLEANVAHVVVFADFLTKYVEPLASSKIESILVVTGAESTPFGSQAAKAAKDRLRNMGVILSPLMFWDDLMGHAEKHRGALDPYYSSDHIAIIVGTSGTTGIPKGACLTDDALNAIAIQHGLSGILDVGDVLLDALIQSIGYGISTMHYSTVYGYKSILIPQLLLSDFPRLLCELKPDHFTGGPVHYRYLSESYEFANGQIPPMKNLVSGGASLPRDVEQFLNGVGEGFEESGKPDQRIIVRQGFGATENGGCGAYSKSGAYKFGGVGIPLPFETIAIFEPETDHELSYGAEGEICISGPTLMKEYLNNPSETKKVLRVHSDGTTWLHLADWGYMDEDGQLYITDRIKDIFMRIGFNIHPSKIEEYIVSLPQVKEVKVVGIDHPHEQKVPVAFVVLSAETKARSKEALNEIAAACRENLDELYVPYDWRIIDELPRNLGGKVDSKLLVAQSGIEYDKANSEEPSVAHSQTVTAST